MIRHDRIAMWTEVACGCLDCSPRSALSMGLTTHPRCPSFADKSEVLQFFFDFAKLADGDIELVTVITNAACIRYQLLGIIM